MAFTLPPLGFPTEALEPHIDAKTMEIHHGKHHQTYVDKLNAALEGASIGNKSVEELLKDLSGIPTDKKQAVVNNGGGHANHTLFWKTLTPGGAKAPEGKLADAVKNYGGFDKLKTDMEAAGANRFGSGWSWLVLDKGKLTVISTANQDSPIMNGQTPIFGINVWEHAYYLKYQNRRPDYMKAIWNVVNWTAVGDNFSKAK